MIRYVVSVVVLAFVLMSIGCSTWRGIPSHGGGKRFDEEQRAVAGSIRQAIADMNVSELAGKKVLVTIESIAQNGGGTLNLPGLTSITGNYNELETTTIDRIDNTQARDGWAVNATVSTTPDLKPTVFVTEPDLKYLEAALNMKLRHAGVGFAPKAAECILYVLVDVLGTNRSRQDSILFWKDNLAATCELTYYAVDTKTNELIFRARRASAQGNYSENSAIAFNAYRIQHSIKEIVPTAFPVDGNVSAVPPENGDAVTPEPNSPQPTFGQTRKMLEQKLRQADSFVQAGNLDAAERLIIEIRQVDPDYPGLDAVTSRLENLRNVNISSSGRHELVK